MHDLIRILSFGKIVVMATSTSSTRKKPVYSKTKNPVRPKWMRVVKLIMIILVSVIMLLAIAGIILEYYKLVSKH